MDNLDPHPKFGGEIAVTMKTVRSKNKAAIEELLVGESAKGQNQQNPAWRCDERQNESSVG